MSIRHVALVLTVVVAAMVSGCIEVSTPLVTPAPSPLPVVTPGITGTPSAGAVATPGSGASPASGATAAESNPVIPSVEPPSSGGAAGSSIAYIKDNDVWLA